VHVLDCGTLDPGRDPLSDLDAIEAELSQYKTSLMDRPRLVVLNKADLPEGRDLADIVTPDLEARGYRVLTVSAVSHLGLRELTFALAEVIEQWRAAQPVEEATRIVLRPTAVDDLGFTVSLEDDVYVVRGSKPERWVLQTDFSNDEAVGYLGDRLARLGVEKQLADLGATPGVEVQIGEVVFDWQPTLLEEFASGMRGQDVRFENRDRTSAEQRRYEKDLRRAERLGLELDE
jgi:GTP-binding protein